MECHTGGGGGLSGDLARRHGVHGRDRTAYDSGVGRGASSATLRPGPKETGRSYLGTEA